MRQRQKPESGTTELQLAISLIWGFLRVEQYEEAYYLARGCLQLWPDDERLLLMAAFAAVEVLEPLDKAMQQALDRTQCEDWARMIRARVTVTAPNS